MSGKNLLLVPIAALTLVASGVGAAPPASNKSSGLLVPLGANDADAFVKELPGENIGDGGEFSVGRNRFIRLEGRHLTFKTASGLKKCVIAPAAAKSWTFGDYGTIGCGDIRLMKAPNTRMKSELGQPVNLTVSRGGRISKISGLWQGLE